MQELTGEIAIVSVATLFLLLITAAPIFFVLMHQRQYHRYLRDNEHLRNVYQRELLQSQLEIQNQTLQQVGYDLHDNIGQLLTVVIMQLNSLEDDLLASTGPNPELAHQVHQTRELVRHIIAEIRILSKSIDPNTVRRYGLLPTLTLELDRIKRAGRVQAQLTTTGEPYLLGEQADIVVLRITQESLNNALKHAQARNLQVLMDYKADAFLLTILDDGRGFDVAQTMNRTLDEAGSGLGNLHRRATMLGGYCQIQSAPGAGTRVEIRLPRTTSTV